MFIGITVSSGDPNETLNEPSVRIDVTADGNTETIQTPLNQVALDVDSASVILNEADKDRTID